MVANAWQMRNSIGCFQLGELSGYPKFESVFHVQLPPYHKETGMWKWQSLPSAGSSQRVWIISVAMGRMMAKRPEESDDIKVSRGLNWSGPSQ